ncbi:MAG: undecaprenyl-diphosphate phosphatase [Candidatus Delongbacteria bacterium]|nr:undecaprenyl-diphosphate phosphatase [Candidatus Delongbacteria bacterium]
MVEAIQAIILGLFQGLTEFLPVSSSGHLAILHKVLCFETESNLFFDVILHLGTLIAVVLFYRNSIIDIIKGGMFGIKSILSKKGIKESFFSSADSKLFSLIIIGSIPTAIIGLTFKDFFEGLADNLLYVGLALLTTAVLLVLFELKKKSFKKINEMSAADSIIIGIVQGIAIIPGISRSGSTISTAKLLGIDKETAAQFSFLLSLPAISGAFLLSMKDAIKEGFVYEHYILLGFITAVITGYFSLKLLIWMIKKSNMYFFAIYCLILAVFAMSY